MFNIVRKSIEWGHDTLTLETGKIARQADAAVVATYGETSVLATVVFEKKPKAGYDFFPLTVHYQEKTYAAGKIPGGFFKREARPSEKEVLTSRLIDRPIRPLFVEGFKNETQVIVTVLSYDMENDPDIVGMIAASAALTLSGAPFLGPIGAARVGFVDGDYVLNPAVDDMERLRGNPEQRLDLDRRRHQGRGDDGRIRGLRALGGRDARRGQVRPRADAAGDRPDHRHGRGSRQGAVRLRRRPTTPRSTRGSKAAGESRDARRLRHPRQAASARTPSRAAKDTIKAALTEEELADANLDACFKKLESDVVRWDILDHGRRIDGRDLVTVRPIVAEVGILPRTHGSALFTRGETQGLVVTTLGTGDDEQLIDALHGSYRTNFLLHYNFPPYSVGEAGRMGSPGPPRDRPRQARLAGAAGGAAGCDRLPLHHPRRLGDHRVRTAPRRWRPSAAASLSMMDGGVPLKAPVAGVAMGLILEGEKFAVLTDILGDEDHLGDMDFKVAGTANGITRCRWTSRSPASPRRSWSRRSPRPRKAGCTSSARWPRADRGPRRSSPPTPRASRPCRSRSTRSARSSAPAAR